MFLIQTALRLNISQLSMFDFQLEYTVSHHVALAGGRWYGQRKFPWIPTETVAAMESRTIDSLSLNPAIAIFLTGVIKLERYLGNASKSGWHSKGHIIHTIIFNRGTVDNWQLFQVLGVDIDTETR